MALKTLQPKVKLGKQKVSVIKRAEPFYVSAEWHELVATLIAQRGRRCEACGKTHEDDGSRVRLIGDHIVERKDGGADLDPQNVKLLCSRAGGDGSPHADGKRGNCHAAKTAMSRRERVRGVGVYIPGAEGARTA